MRKGDSLMKDYTEYIVEQTQKLLSIDSPTGYTKNVAAYLMKVYTELGYEPMLTTKGGVFVKIADGVSEDGKSAIPLPDRFSLRPMWIHWGNGIGNHLRGAPEPDPVRSMNLIMRKRKLPHRYEKRKRIYRYLPASQCFHPCKRGI